MVWPYPPLEKKLGVGVTVASHRLHAPLIPQAQGTAANGPTPPPKKKKLYPLISIFANTFLPYVRGCCIILGSPRLGSINPFSINLQPVSHLLKTFLENGINPAICSWAYIHKHVSSAANEQQRKYKCNIRLKIHVLGRTDRQYGWMRTQMDRCMAN